MLTAQLLGNACLGILLALVVLRSDHRRRDNQLLALTFMVDNLLLLGLTAAVSTGAALTSPPLIRFALVCRVLLVHPLFEFARAFPTGRTPPRLLYALIPSTAAWFQTWSPLVFFLPYATFVALAFAHNLRKVERRVDAQGVRIIAGAVMARWLFELIMLSLQAPAPALFEWLFLFDMGILSFVFKAILAFVVLRHGFFRVQGVLAEVALWAAFGLTLLGLIAAIDELALAVVLPPARRVILLLAGVTPCILLALLHGTRPQIEAALLSPLDPHRGKLRNVLERVMRETANRVEPSSLCSLTTNALEELSGGQAAFLAQPSTRGPGFGFHMHGAVSLSTELAEQLEATALAYVSRLDAGALTPELHRMLEQQQIDLLVPVRFQHTLLGALALRSVELDRDTAKTCVALADNLATMLTHAALHEHAYRLQSEIEVTRHLATLGSFAAAFAHDIRTPLTSLRINLQMIRSDAPLNDTLRECADIALEELQRLSEYVTNVLDFSKPVRLQMDSIDIERLLLQTADRLEPLFAARRIQIDVQVGPQRLPPVLGDVARIRRVLFNLLENAADASQPGKVVRLCARVVDGERIAIDVCDSGCGIQAQDLESLFDPFFTTRAEGTGLGLAIAKKLVLAHAGEITVKSELARGSTFSVLLPTGSPVPASTALSRGVTAG